MSVFSRVLTRLSFLPEFVARRSTFVTTANGQLDPSGSLGGGPERIEVEPQDALLVAAKRCDSPWVDRYNLLLDLDTENVALVRSSGGHGYHLYVAAHMTKEEHDAVMTALARAGVIERGFAESGVKSKYGTTLRLPWVRKGADKTLAQIEAGASEYPPSPEQALGDYVDVGHTTDPWL